MSKIAWAVIAVVFLAPGVHAQATPAADVALQASFFNVLTGYTIAMGGASGSVALNANRWFGVAGDVGVYHGHPSESLTGETYTIGPRVSCRRFDRLVPYAEALFGGSHFSASSGGITGQGSQFAYTLGGGADIVLSRSGKAGLRLEGSYFGVRSGGATTPCTRLSAGIVFRVGKR